MNIRCFNIRCFNLRCFVRTSALLGTFVLLTSAAFAQQLTKTELPGKSATVGLAPGWKLAGGTNGAVTATGPNGAIINLGIQLPVVTRGVERLFPDVPVVFPGVLRADFTDPVRAELDLAAQLGPKQGIKISRIRTVEYVNWDNGKAAFVRSTVMIKNVKYETFGIYAIMPIDNAQGSFYMSEIAAPSAEFQKIYPTMMAMWHSWSLNKSTIDKRLDSAAKALAEVDFVGTVDSVVRERRAAGERAAKKFDEYIRQ